MTKRELLAAFRTLTFAGRDSKVCTDCTYCTNCIGCSSCYGCTDCNYCAYCTNCYSCDDCTDCLLCKGLKGVKDGYWILNKRVTEEEFKKALRIVLSIGTQVAICNTSKEVWTFEELVNTLATEYDWDIKLVKDKD